MVYALSGILQVYSDMFGLGRKSSHVTDVPSSKLVCLLLAFTSLLLSLTRYFMFWLLYSYSSTLYFTFTESLEHSLSAVIII